MRSGMVPLKRPRIGAKHRHTLSHTAYVFFCSLPYSDMLASSRGNHSVRLGFQIFKT